MRFLEKKGSPSFFEEEKVRRNFSEKTMWKRFGNPYKQMLTSYIKQEQNGLCAYCECNIDINEAKIHLEHIKPQSKNPEFRWSYNNLVVSCVGYDDDKKKEKQSCGSHTHDNYEEEFFLNPVEVRDISTYFVFAIKADKSNEILEGMILPSQNANKREKAQYTIECLGLNADHLIKERKAAKKLFTDLSRKPDFDIMATLDASPPFVSFLRYYFLPNVVNIA
jgi:uncharacterized protein (TIGR02646 family)